MTLLAKVLPVTLDQNPAARVFDLLLGGGDGGRPPQRDARGVLIRLIIVALERAEERVVAMDDMMEVMGLLRGIPAELAAVSSQAICHCFKLLAISGAVSTGCLWFAGAGGVSDAGGVRQDEV